MSYHSILRNSRAVPPYPVLYNFHKFNVQCSFQEGEEGAKGREGEGGGRGRGRGFPIIIFSRPNLLLAFSSDQLFLFVVLEKKRICFQSAIIPPRE